MEILQAKNYQINGLQEKLTKLITGLPRSKNIELVKCFFFHIIFFGL